MSAIGTAAEVGASIVQWIIKLAKGETTPVRTTPPRKDRQKEIEERVLREMRERDQPAEPDDEPWE